MSTLKSILEAQTGESKVPKVMLRAGRLAALVVALGCVVGRVSGQAPDSAKTPVPVTPGPATPAPTPGPAESLYLKLQSVGLDPARVYKVREASLERAALHISLDDGTIAFTEDAGGHITGAFFKGEGEVLLFPPNITERASLAQFTQAAILEEKFSTAYFRFNDDVFGELQPALRPMDDAASFAAEWNTTAHNLAQGDALRLLFTFSRDLPPAEKPPANDHFLHAYLQGDRLGAFNARYDSLQSEQIAAGQHKTVEGEDFYNVWVSFPVAARPGAAITDRDADGDPTPEVAISQFKIQAAITPPTELAANAVLRVAARKDKDTGRMLLFELSRFLKVKEVKADGRPVEFIHNQAIEGSQLARRGNEVLAVFLPAPLRAGQDIELSFDYSGSVLSEAANGLLYVGEHGTWYPSLGFAMAPFTLQFRYPVGWTLVATGRRTQDDTGTETKTAASEQSSTWVSDRPVPVAGFNLGKFSQTTTHAAGVDVVTYATGRVEKGFAGTTTDETKAPDIFKLPSSAVPLGTFAPAENAQMVGAISAKAVDFYQQRFGPFPYNQLALTQFPGNISQGWPGLIFLSSLEFLSPQQLERVEGDPNQRLIEQQIIAHETAHQWWGDLVTWRGYRDQWIMEALANYSALMLLESHDPAKSRQVLQTYRDDLLTKNRDGVPPMDAGPVTLGLRLSSSQSPNGYAVISYGRGTWLFHMLRTMMRDAERKSGAPRAQKAEDEPFVRALRRLRKEYEGRAINTAQLMTVLEAELPPSLWYEGHKSLDWFYEGWVNGTAVPAFGLRGVKFTDKPGSTLITGTIVQDEAPDSLVTAVPLYASVAGKNVFLGHVFAEGKETAFHLSAPAGVRKVLLDPEQTLLARER
jgi:hypothetical protein